MNLLKIITVGAALAMMSATPALAAKSGSSLAGVGRVGVASQVRAGANVEDENRLAGGSVVIAVLAAAAIIAGIIIAADGDDEPVSA